MGMSVQPPIPRGELFSFLLSFYIYFIYILLYLHIYKKRNINIKKGGGGRRECVSCITRKKSPTSMPVLSRFRIVNVVQYQYNQLF